MGEVYLCSEAGGKSDLEGIARFRPAELLRTPEKRCPASIPAAAPPTTMLRTEERGERYDRCHIISRQNTPTFPLDYSMKSVTQQECNVPDNKCIHTNTAQIQNVKKKQAFPARVFLFPTGRVFFKGRLGLAGKGQVAWITEDMCL